MAWPLPHLIPYNQLHVRHAVSGGVPGLLHEIGLGYKYVLDFRKLEVDEAKLNKLSIEEDVFVRLITLVKRPVDVDHHPIDVFIFIFSCVNVIKFCSEIWFPSFLIEMTLNLPYCKS